MTDNAALVVEILHLATATVTLVTAFIGLTVTTRQSFAQKGRRKKKSHRH